MQLRRLRAALILNVTGKDSYIQLSNQANVMIFNETWTPPNAKGSDINYFAFLCNLK